jgi:hypothetical protein
LTLVPVKDGGLSGSFSAYVVFPGTVVLTDAGLGFPDAGTLSGSFQAKVCP